MINVLTQPIFYVILSAILSIILSILAISIALNAIISVKAMQKSTHSVEYMPIDPKIDGENKEYMEKWATSDKAIKEQDKLFREDLEDNMPIFSENKEDKKIYSF